MKSFVEHINDNLNELYPNKVYNLDNDIEFLLNDGWTISNQHERSDFLIYDINNVLVEIKEINKDKEDQRIEKELSNSFLSNEIKGVGFYVPDMRAKVRNLISVANRQYKSFIESNKNKFSSISETSSITVLRCSKISTNYRIPSIIELIYGSTHQEIDWGFSSTFFIKNKILNQNRYTHTSHVANWTSENRFIIYNNPFSILNNKTPIFLTKHDVNYIFNGELHDVFERYGVRVMIFEKYEYEKKSNYIFLIDDRWIEPEYAKDYLIAKVIEANKLDIEMKNTLLKLHKK